MRLSAPHRAEAPLQLLHLGGVDCRQRLLLPDTVPRGLGLGVLGLARLLLHISEELAQLSARKRAVSSLPSSGCSSR